MLAIPRKLARVHNALSNPPSAPRDNAIARYEMKYLVDVRLVPEIRDFVQLFCRKDPYCKGFPPEYQVDTLQLDNHWGDLYLAKERKAINRFKLRARTYGPSESSPLFLEIKRKIGDTVVKSRASFRPGWGNLRELILGGSPNGLLKKGHEMDFYEFVRLVRDLDARPCMRIRYQRESYISENDGYARVTFDRKLQYLPTREWDLSIDVPGAHWQSMDTGTAINRPFPGVILELKSTDDMASWMAELIERFNLVRCDFCKYATAMRLESIFMGHQYSDASDNCTYY